MEKMDMTIMEIIKELNSRITLIDRIPDWRLRTICYYSVLDSYAQADAKYNAKISNGKIFREFVMKYQKSFDFLSQVDPITLAYELGCEISDMVPDFRSVGQSIITCKDLMNEKIVVPKGLSSEVADRHRYINLLYVMRNKLVHEQEAPSGINESSQIDVFPHIPFFTHQLGNDDTEDSWVLTIPSSFVRDILRETVNGYLNRCLEENVHPFGSFNKTHELNHISWSKR